MQQYIIGNWKMNGTKEDAQKFASGFLKLIQKADRSLPHVILCPSYPYLTTVVDLLKNSPIEVGAQDAHPDEKGSYTGDVSIAQLKDVGCKYVIVGHSERRNHHKESSALIHQKVEAAVKAGIRPIICVGEKEDERNHGKTLEVIGQQIESDLPHIYQPHEIIIAYEPLWAIGTGKLPKPEEVEEVLGFIKHELNVKMTGGALVPTLYGGSINAKNAQPFLDIPHGDGLLVGGASLNLDEFWEIVNESTR